MYTLELALLQLTRTALRHKIVAKKHVALGLLDFLLDRPGFGFNLSGCVEGHLVDLVSLFVLGPVPNVEFLWDENLLRTASKVLIFVARERPAAHDKFLLIGDSLRFLGLPCSEGRLLGNMLDLEHL